MAIKGFLPGPYENRPSLDELAQMMGGLAFMTGPPGRPLRAGASIIDIGAATYGVIGILAALYQRARDRPRPEDHVGAVRDDRVLGRAMDGARGRDRPAVAADGGGRSVGAHGLGHLPSVRDQGRRAGVHRRHLERALGAVLRGFDLPDLFADERLNTNEKRVPGRNGCCRASAKRR